jgi:hypothetical protein
VVRVRVRVGIKCRNDSMYQHTPQKWKLLTSAKNSSPYKLLALMELVARGCWLIEREEYLPSF